MTKLTNGQRGARATVSAARASRPRHPEEAPGAGRRRRRWTDAVAQRFLVVG